MKFRIQTVYSLTHSIEHEAEDNDGIVAAYDAGEIETDATICAQCSGWGKRGVSLEVGEAEAVAILDGDGEPVFEDDWHYCKASADAARENLQLKAEIERLKSETGCPSCACQTCSEKQKAAESE